MTKGDSTTLTAAQEILLGAGDLHRAGRPEFSEWDLSVSTWRRNPNRFGCRGYESIYPDHKRVMMEIMGTTKRDNPLRRGWLERVRPNTYRLTNVGIVEADRVSAGGRFSQQSLRSPQAIYDAVKPFYTSDVFRRHGRDPEEPRLWTGAASFLHLASRDPQHVEDRIRSTGTATSNALEWMDEGGVDQMRSGVTGGQEAISKSSLVRLQDFYNFILRRFSAQFDAIKAAKR